MLFKGEFGFIEIIILGKQYPGSNDNDDRHWLDGEIKIEVPGFQAHYNANLYLPDLTEFYNQLSQLNTEGSQKANFNAIEDNLILKLNLDNKGTILCEGMAFHEGNSLKFKFETDLYTVEKFCIDLKSLLNRL